MKAALSILKSELYHVVEGKRIEGVHLNIRGDVSGLRGDVSGLSGDVSGLRGDVSGLRGYVSGLRGDVSGLRGDIDDCELSQEDRAKGIDATLLIAPIA